MEKESRLAIELGGNGDFKLVAERSNDPLFPHEMYIGIVNGDGEWVQDLVVVQQADHKGPEPNDTKPIDEDSFNVLVYGDPDIDDCTARFTIRKRAK